MNLLRIGVIGDYNPDYPLHPKTNEAIRHAVDDGAVKLEIEWLSTKQEHDLSHFHGIWCSPGSPYLSLDGALRMIRWSRINAMPFLGTCGGSQHAILEFARNVMNIEDAQHAEYDPYASILFVSRLACSLVGRVMPLELKAGSVAALIYGKSRVEEHYYCNFGLNPQYQSALELAGMKITGWDEGQEARIFELADHPFFVATLFVPQARSTPEDPHPIVRSFVSMSLRRARGVTAAM
jgi:CTP synthase (UTP-ammonia lyase)